MIVEERAFGLLKERFRIPNKQEDTSLNRVCNVLSACCVPHYFCVFHGVEAEDDWVIVEADDDWMIADDDDDDDDDDEMSMRMTIMMLTSSQ